MSNTTREVQVTPAATRAAAYHLAGDIILHSQFTDVRPVRVTIISRGALRHTYWSSGSAPVVPTRAELVNQLTIAIGGLIAQRKQSGSAANDLCDVHSLRYAHTLARRIVNKCDGPSDDPEAAVRTLVEQCTARAEQYVDEHWDIITMLAETLIEKEELKEGDLNALVP